MLQERVPLQSPGFAARKRRARVIRGAALLALVLLLIGALVFLARLSNVRIENIYVEGNAVISEQSIQEAVQKAISGNYLYLFPKDNVGLYPKATIAASLTNAFKPIQSVEVSLKDLRGLLVTVVERKPHALWCGQEFSNMSKGQCYFLDDAGYIFAKAPDFSGNVFFKYFGGSLSSDPVGSELIETERFKVLEFFITALSQAGFHIVALHLRSSGVYEAYMEDGGRIIFNDKQDYAALLANLKTLVESDSFKAKISSDASNIDYIDLQYGNKIFYRPAQ